MNPTAKLKTALLTSAILASSALTVSAELRAVASIKPVHSLVAAVMEGAGTPELLLPAGSPHHYSLKPSQAAVLEKADIVFWIGHELETFLEKPVETIAASAKSVELIDADGLTRLDFREGGTFEKHDGDEHGHGEHAEEEHDHEEHGEEEHAHDETDPHIWLDPHNAKAMVGAIEAALSEADPENKQLYAENAKAVAARLDALTAEISDRLTPVRDKPFIVFHDAYHYFENRFRIPAAGSITVSPERTPGAERIGEIRAKIGELGAACVFSEPQFEPKLVTTLTGETGAGTGTLDPLGRSLRQAPASTSP